MSTLDRSQAGDSLYGAKAGILAVLRTLEATPAGAEVMLARRRTSPAVVFAVVAAAVIADLRASLGAWLRRPLAYWRARGGRT
jgi:hypothetical protein